SGRRGAASLAAAPAVWHARTSLAAHGPAAHDRKKRYDRLVFPRAHRRRTDGRRRLQAHRPPASKMDDQRSQRSHASPQERLRRRARTGLRSAPRGKLARSAGTPRRREGIAQVLITVHRFGRLNTKTRRRKDAKIIG